MHCFERRGECRAPPFRASNRHTISIEFVIFVIATLAGPKIGEVSHELDRSDPFDHLEAQFVLATQPKWRAMQNAERLPVHLIGEDSQAVAHVVYLVDVVVAASRGALRE